MSGANGAFVGFTLVDLYKFFSVILHILLIRKPKLGDYDSTNPVLYSPFPTLIRLSRNKFLRIVRYLHAVDNACRVQAGSASHDKLAKIRFLIDHLLERFSVYTPGPN